MATEQSLGQEAVDLAQQTSYSWEQYLHRVHTDLDYKYKDTTWFKAGAKLEEAKHLSPPPKPPVNDLASVRARIFLAGNPLDCLAAPDWMVPVLSADRGNYEGEDESWGDEQFYDFLAEIRDELLDSFDLVECWCDCRVPSGYVPGVGTGFDVALAVNEAVILDGAWGQCETTGELENGYNAGARRFIGSCDPNVMDDAWLNKVKTGEILMTVELYRNAMPWMLPDWRNANAGIGGNCIACYESAREGAVYTPVQAYKDQGLYVPEHDSVYGVGLAHADWLALA